MLPSPIARQRVQAIARWVAKILKAHRSVEHSQPVERAILNVDGQLAAAFAIPDRLCFGIRKAQYRHQIVPSAVAIPNGIRRMLDGISDYSPTASQVRGSPFEPAFSALGK
jgi:hypothetical protein